MAEGIKGVVIKKEQKVDVVDTQIADEVCNKIKGMISKHTEAAVKEVGEYLINEFFDGDYEKASKKDKIKNSSKGDTLNQVFDYFKRKKSDNDEETSKTPSKSWLYQAIDFVVQEKDLEDRLDDKTFQTYGKLLLSHKVALLGLPLKEKEKLIEKASSEDLSVRALKMEITKNNKTKKRNPGILTIINNPKLYDTEKQKKLISDEYLKKQGYSKLIKIPEKIKEKQNALKTELEELKEMISEHEKSIENLETLKPLIQKAIKTTKGTTRKRKQKTED